MTGDDNSAEFERHDTHMFKKVLRGTKRVTNLVVNFVNFLKMLLLFHS